MIPAVQGAATRIEVQVGLLYEIDSPVADFIFHIHAARTGFQAIRHEALTLNPALAPRLSCDALTGNRAMALRVPAGVFEIHYTATVDMRHALREPTQIDEVPLSELPPTVVGYLYPSRYCPSDRLLNLARDEFAHVAPGYSRVQAIRDWVFRTVRFTSNSSNSSTSALDTLVGRVGVCRDFAHLMIALCRALNIPARFATGTDYGADVALGPPDFQAYVEVYLEGGWYIFDPSGTAIPMGFVRFATGRDAADVAFATLFGSVRAHAPMIRTTAFADPVEGIVLPWACTQALSTDSGPT